jgi:hypothetical protein
MTSRIDQQTTVAEMIGKQCLVDVVSHMDTAQTDYLASNESRPS